ncbi:zinc finger and BTB domain-containing protein 1 [Kryptolebias marmoratus]|uniref:Zinc finger and BTB domain containing 1 n=1 Tax=Kryptolebias marmoratus TaxID=37003 RepID=A0A3Q3BQL5_KRYMA|nr:zinc finger and BTB domain-containing protein 1 [Kryptolebias marmoratus]XP_017297219.1 zinc finger and BTB domain-containing protein 1 [Kryptolebias marmoratus]XP_017297220.1 zinc finger and BTB domain-containing protein 1 [Kryptolebias marmoratus]XP_037837375.1 zinc finger and BTB domain-containing protein 1 [Kryptolebias marmoratus]
MARPSHSDHVLQQLNNQREWGFLCDCLIAIGDIYFRAHKAVLAACSSYFRMMFIRDQQGAGHLDLSNMQISAECFDLILQLMYLGRIVVGSYEFEELKASMAYLQMYYIPDSLEDLRDIRSSNLTPSSSASSSSSSTSSTGVSGGKMMFGVRMYEQQRSAAPEGEILTKAVSSGGGGSGRPAVPAAVSRPIVTEEVVASAPLIVAPPAADGAAEQPCDLRKRSGGRSATLKDRPRFGRTYTCDDCGFVFSCEKLLIEHILTCTNRKAFHPARGSADGDNSSGKAESSASESTEEQRVVCKGEDDWAEAKADLDLPIRSVAAGTDGKPGSTRTVKTEPEESVFSEIEMVQIGDHVTRDCSSRLSDVTRKDLLRLNRDSEPGVSGLESSSEPIDGHPSSSNDSGIPSKLRRVKDERLDPDCAPCELCGALLAEEDKSTHYLSNHMGHICACGRCGQVLIKGRQLQEHAERCGESHGGESDSHGEDEASLLEEAQGMEEGLLEAADLACPHCGLLFQNESLALEHALSCHDQELFRPVALEEGGGEPDHRRKHFCSICGKGFYQRCHLREHYTVHTKEKQFTCQTCGKQFLRERQLRLHTDMHKGMARYVCPVCDQGTFLKHDHVRHMISHLSAGETICQVCFQIFPGGEQLEKHMDVHLYICGVCGEKFRLRKDMRSHYNSKHTKRL